MRGRMILKRSLCLVLIVMVDSLACGAVPPDFVVQQQNRAVYAYCAEWRKAHGTLTAGEMNRRVIMRLEERYPTVFPDCRPSDRQQCRSWLNALVEGLRRYGQRSVKSVCSTLRDD